VSVLVKEREEIIEAVSAFSAEGVAALSATRNEPAWMRQFRLDAWATFESIPWPKANDEAWRRTRLTGFKLDKFETFTELVNKQELSQLPAVLQAELAEVYAFSIGLDWAEQLIDGPLPADLLDRFAQDGYDITSEA